MIQEQDLTFQPGGLTLAGTLCRPEGAGPFPAVLLVSGSGQVDRDENAPTLRIHAMAEIAAHLALRGLASLRYDKRGVGASQGDYWSTGFFDNVADAAAALAALRAQPGIRPEAVFVMGHSEGAAITMRLAGTGAPMAGAIVLAGPAHCGEDVLRWQAVQTARTLRGFNRLVIDLFHIDVLKTQQKELAKIKRSEQDWYRVALGTRKLNAKWFREFMAYNPGDDLRQVRVPMLAVTGAKDIQVDPADLRHMAERVPGEFEWRELPNVTHLLRAEAGAPSLASYPEQVKQPVDQRVLSTITDWLLRHVEEQSRLAAH